MELDRQKRLQCLVLFKNEISLAVLSVCALILQPWFDTTTSNTGAQAGACVLLEKKLGRVLISLACRHHIMKLIVAKVFETLMGPSSGPKIKLFQRFCEYLSSTDRYSYESVLLYSSALMPVRDDLIRFIQRKLTAFHPRDDYRELLQLSLLFLGAEPNGDVHIWAPGACHRARWMANLFIALKFTCFAPNSD